MSHRSVFLIAAALILLAIPAQAHCDRADGPVVADGRAALASGNLDGALKWVGAAQEKELKEAFALSRAVRGGDAKHAELADRYFLETLVRLHREMEGESYSGIKPADKPLPPAIVHADKALDEGKLGDLGAHLGMAASKGVEKRFQEALEAKKHAGESVEAGRHFTAVYAEYVRYVEALDGAIQAQAHGH